MSRRISTIEHRAWLGFATVVIAAAGIGWLIYMNAARVQEDHDALARTNQTLGAIDAALSSLQEVESGQRGYIITGDPEYLTQFNDGARAVGEDLPRLKTLTAQDPLQQERLTSLEALASEKISFARQSIAIRDSRGEDAADQFVASGRGKAVLDETRALVRGMQQTETERLQLRNDASDVTARNTTILTLALAVLSLALVAVLLALITRNLASQRRAAEANARLSATAAASNDAILGIDLDGRVTQWNTGAERIFGYSRTEALGQPISFFVPSDQADALQSNLALMRQGAGVVDQDSVGLAKGGLRVDVAVSTFPVYDASGVVNGSGAVIRDMTERKRAQDAQRQIEEALRASEERFRSVVESANDAIVIIDSQGIIEHFNQSAESIFGYSASEAMGRNVSLLMPSPHREAHDSYIARFLATGERRLTPNRELSGVRKDGSEFPMEFTVSVARTDREVRFTGIIRDISRRKQLEAELRQATEAAQEANRAKSDFLSRMSHELRTPLNVVLGFGQVLQLDPLEPQQTEAVDYILKAGRHLLELIDEVLDLSRIESGRLSLSIEPVRADEILADVLMLMRPLASERRITIRADLEACDCFIVADRQRLRQVLLNLLSNAIKYNREGGAVDITCAKVADSALRIMVTDGGPGLAPEKIGRLFVAFDRLGAEATGVEGTGLGLALSRHLVEAMGGAIGVESTVDIGSTFWFELSLTEAPAHPLEEVSSAVDASRSRLAGQRSVLYIEDNVANLNLMERILVGRLGFRLLAAMQGSLGLDLASDHQPDLILLDLHLPDMPGSEVLQRLQDNPATRGIPVVIISADAMPGQVARLRAAGARAYITKPFDVKELLELIDSLFPDAT